MPLRLILHKATWREGPAAAFPSGQIIVPPGDTSHFFVAAGLGSQLEILEVQPAGKRRMAVAEFLRGHRLQSGDRLGLESS